ncbi:hypothetical protein [Pacificoceanicola onchidii]|uniref:hypothetical protein n=1 Tax=Pacificoceanicola onchidii TaxID=2562685 RepID=UPI0010A6A168|nr:hypothetical protein [Pacificoceanicola onchidii]
MGCRLRLASLCLGLLAASASAQTPPIRNVFFGFDFVLTPVAVKWACGGAWEQDFFQIDALVQAFPENAEAADLQTLVATLVDTANGEAGLSRLIGVNLTPEQVETLCAAALPLNLDWITPEDLAQGTDDGISPEQRAAWEAFYRISEGFR